MTPAEVVMLAYWLVMAALVIIAIAFALWFSGLSHRPVAAIDLRTIPQSFDCKAAVHDGCQVCSCQCHWGDDR